MERVGVTVGATAALQETPLLRCLQGGERR